MVAIITQGDLRDRKILYGTQKSSVIYLSCPMIEPFYRYKMTNNSWQEFVDNYRTFAADIEYDMKRVRELLDGAESESFTET